MQREMTASGSLWTEPASWFARLMRLDVPPVIKPLTQGYDERRALPFIFDIVRSMLLGRALWVVAAAIVSQMMFSLQPYGLAPILFI